MITLLFFHLAVFSSAVTESPSSDQFIVWSLCSKHLPAGLCLRETWLESKSSLNREREKPVRTLVHQATSLLPSVYCGGRWDR